MSKLTFSQKMKMGKWGEEIALRYLIEKLGATVLPAADYVPDNKGPRVSSSDKKTVAPDLLVWKGKRAYWVEVKTKNSFSWHYISNSWQTGIDYKYYVEYKSMHDSSPWPVYMMFLQLGESRHDDRVGVRQPSGLYYNSIGVLGEPGVGRRHTDERRDMIYWKITNLIKLAELDEIIDWYDTLQL